MCPKASQAPLDASKLDICKDASVASTDFRFAKAGGSVSGGAVSSGSKAGGAAFNVTTAKDPGCGEALWKQLGIIIICRFFFW